MPIDAVCFDNDGLTLETESAWTNAEVELFARHGSAFTDDHKRYMLGSSSEVAARKLEEMLGQPGRGTALWAELHDLVMAEVERGVEPMPGAVALIDALRAAGTPVALVSNSAREFVELGLRGAGLDDRFDAVFAREDVEHGKPAPDLYLAACAALGADPAACAGLEDSSTGVAALKAAGMFAIGIPSFPGVALEQADLVAPSLEDPAVHRALGL
ncbi:MAG: family phosphatase [Solirubrobacterales bacterium]|nr:family phosphatase [Solirubrobacterales bacterium]